LGQSKYGSDSLIEYLHNGRTVNYESILVSRIDEKFTIILLDNNYNGKLDEISGAIIAILKDQNNAFEN